MGEGDLPRIPEELFEGGKDSIIIKFSDFKINASKDVEEVKLLSDFGRIAKDKNGELILIVKKELEDADAMRDAQRKMTWFALAGLLLYPLAVVIASMAGLTEAQKTLGSMAPTYFVAVAGIVAAFFGAQALSKKSAKK